MRHGSLRLTVATPISARARQAPSPPKTLQSAPPDLLASATRKAFRRLLPLLFLCYIVAYVDRANVSLAKLTMSRDMPAFNDAVIGFGAGVFFAGYFLLEIPGTLIV